MNSINGTVSRSTNFNSQSSPANWPYSKYSIVKDLFWCICMSPECWYLELPERGKIKTLPIILISVSLLFFDGSLQECCPKIHGHFRKLSCPHIHWLFAYLAMMLVDKRRARKHSWRIDWPGLTKTKSCLQVQLACSSLAEEWLVTHWGGRHALCPYVYAISSRSHCFKSVNETGYSVFYDKAGTKEGGPHMSSVWNVAHGKAGVMLVFCGMEMPHSWAPASKDKSRLARQIIRCRLYALNPLVWSWKG